MNCDARKCIHCGKIFFYIENEICPFCKKSLAETVSDGFMNFFKDIVNKDSFDIFKSDTR